MSIKQLYIAGAGLLGFFLFAQSLQAESNFGQIISYDDDEVEVRINGEIDYWPVAKLGSLPLDIQDKDKTNFVKIEVAGAGVVWVSLSYVTTNQPTLKKNCQSQKLAVNESKKQFGARGIGEACK